MPNPTPTLDAVLNAVAETLGGQTPTLGAVYGWESWRPDEAELLDELRDAYGNLDVWYVDGAARGDEGAAPGERYALYDVVVRHVCVRGNDEEATSRQGRFQLERAATLLEGVDAIFAPGAQQPVHGTPKTVNREGGTVDRHDSRFFEGFLRFTVEGRRWA